MTRILLPIREDKEHIPGLGISRLRYLHPACLKVGQLPAGDRSKLFIRASQLFNLIFYCPFFEDLLSIPAVH
jgi:hypothetical protein